METEVLEVEDNIEETESRRQLVTVQRILELLPIEGADRIEVASILGWYVVVQKGLHKVGDLVAYAEVDSVFPATEQWKDLEKVKYRIKTIRLRGQISQGYAVPLRHLPQFEPTMIDLTGRDEYHEDGLFRLPEGSELPFVLVEEGLDITDILGVKKYEIPVNNSGQGGLNVSGRKSNFPGWISKTDEIRIQAVPGVLERHKGKEFYAAEKLDGSSLTAYLLDGKFSVCSRNFDLIEENEVNDFWKAARECGLEEKLRNLHEQTGQWWAVQGEMVGPGKNGNKLKLTEVSVYIFNVFNINEGRHLNYDEFIDVCDEYGFDHVPILERFTLDHTVQALVAKATVKTALGTGVWAEGVVFRPVIEDRDPKVGRLSFKVINPEFLLKHG